MRHALLLGFLPLLSACTAHVFSPPGRVLPLETAATLAPGKTAVQVSGGHHNSDALLFDGPTVTTGTLQVRSSLGEGTEAVIEGSVLHVEEEGASDTDPNIYALRLGAKRQLASWLSLTAGAAGGASAGGSFFSPDLGFVASYENRYVIPFFSARGMVSLPIESRLVDVTESGATTRDLQRPRTTYGMGLAAGLKIPFLMGGVGRPGGALLAGVGATELTDRFENLSLAEARVGLELSF